MLAMTIALFRYLWCMGFAPRNLTVDGLELWWWRMADVQHIENLDRMSRSASAFGITWIENAARVREQIRHPETGRMRTVQTRGVSLRKGACGGKAFLVMAFFWGFLLCGHSSLYVPRFGLKPTIVILCLFVLGFPQFLLHYEFNGSVCLSTLLHLYNELTS
ncbi:uncharacterized protein EV422DRAFT_534831 [Fimicolochytrium jonesii]|uniref:uncharacterized protein n=1 Tax=Fimicolochytrium jonesii TaxID=1396493 RepID=UPI0022FE42EF|nr:uncharacterized protein EV422DRAFT_534831 [Fimicolochytrium jonesii]KAI8819459.1 hypothetical protein EV422DRAFT_534831 [Fimicolochytrium jonesii]